MPVRYTPITPETALSTRVRRTAMPKPFDATLKDLIRNHPADWLRHLGIPFTHPPQVIDADLSAVTASADTLLRADDSVIHIDLQAGPDADLPERLLLYNVLARRLTKLPVRSVAVLLRSNAQTASLTDRVEYADLTFRFELVKVWEIPVDVLLAGGVGVLPLAVLGRTPRGVSREDALADVVRRIADRADRDAKPVADQVLTSAFILSGMHHDLGLSRVIFQRVLSMRESVTYLAILEEGAIEHMHQVLTKQGRTKFGPPTPEQSAKLKAIQDLERLDRLAVRLLRVASWDALLRGR